MENIRVNIAEREIPLRFRMTEFRDIEEEVGNLSEVKELVLKGRNRIRNVVTIIRILGNAGLAAAGMKPDLTDQWLTEHMDPYSLAVYQVSILACLTQESESEAKQEENENKERDLVLEEIDAKKGPVNLPTGG